MGIDNPGPAGTFKTVVRTQKTVLENLRRHEERQQKALQDMLGMVNDGDSKDHISSQSKSEVNEASEQCEGDAENIRTKLVAFVQEVLENVAGIDFVLMNMEEGMKHFKALQKEAQGERRNRWLRRYANTAYNYFK